MNTTQNASLAREVLEFVGLRPLTKEELLQHFWAINGGKEPTEMQRHFAEESRDNSQNVLESQPRNLLIVRERLVRAVIVIPDRAGPGFTVRKEGLYARSAPEERYAAIAGLASSLPTTRRSHATVADVVQHGLEVCLRAQDNKVFHDRILQSVLEATVHTTDYWVAVLPSCGEEGPMIYGSIQEDDYWPLQELLDDVKTDKFAAPQSIGSVVAAYRPRGWRIESHVVLADGRHPEDPTRP